MTRWVAVMVRQVPGGVQLAHTLYKDVLEDMADAGTSSKLRCGQLLATPIQHLTISHCVRIQQPQQQSSTAVSTSAVGIITCSNLGLGKCYLHM